MLLGGGVFVGVCQIFSSFSCWNQSVTLARWMQDWMYWLHNWTFAWKFSFLFLIIQRHWIIQLADKNRKQHFVFHTQFFLLLDFLFCLEAKVKAALPPYYYYNWNSRAWLLHIFQGSLDFRIYVVILITTCPSTSSLSFTFLHSFAFVLLSASTSLVARR